MTFGTRTRGSVCRLTNWISCGIWSGSENIEGTGKVTYTGIKYVAELGTRQTTVSDEALAALVNEFLSTVLISP